MGRKKGLKNTVRKISEDYHAFIKIFGKPYEATGATIEEAISNLKPDGMARGVTVLVLRKGAKTQEKILPKLATVRLFAPSKMIRDVALKITAARFDL